MQPVSAALRTVLEGATLADPRDLSILFEFYPHTTLPGADGFDPAGASQRFAALDLTWLGLAYRRVVLSASDIQKSKGARSNRCTVRLSNADEGRYAATWATQNQIEGLRLVVRLISRSASVALADSAVLFVGRCERPEGFDTTQGTITAVADFGSTDFELPPRSFTPDDPEGRSPADPLFEGFPWIVLSGTFTHPDPGRDFWRQSLRHWQTRPYSSFDNTPLGEPIPLVFGRSQLKQHRGVFVDEGRVTKCLDFLCMGPISAIRDFRMLNSPEYQSFFSTLENVTYHLGEAGGTGTQTVDPLWPNHPPFSYTAYVGYSFRYVGSGAFSQIDAGHDTVATVFGLAVSLPDSAGVFNTSGWTDNGAYITRHLLTSPRFFNNDPAFVEDSECFATGLYNDRPVVDRTNSEVIYLPDPDADAALLRYHSTGLIDPNRARFLLGITTTRPELLAATDFTEYNPFTPPLIAVEVTRLRKAFTTNVVLRKRVKGLDFLFSTVLQSYRAFLVWNWRGKIAVRSERPADFAHLRAGTIAGAATLPVDDVLPWAASAGLWGRVVVGATLTTSEVRVVTAAEYTADANSITLSASATGATTATASAATLTLGSPTVRASGTVTIGGTPAAGNQATITVNGHSITHTVEAAETVATVSYMLAQHVNAHTELRRFVEAAASGAVVTLRSRWGVLTLSPALQNAHAGPLPNPATAPAGVTASGTGSSLRAGTYRISYADRNARGATYPTPYSTVTVAAGQNVVVPALSLAAGATARDWHLSKAPNDPEMVLAATDATGGTFSITAPPASTAAFPEEYNTTAEEIVRVAHSFASNNQDPPAWGALRLYDLGERVQPAVVNQRWYEVTTAGTSGAAEPAWPTASGATVTSGTVVFTDRGPTRLAQAGLTRGNVFAGTYKWPLSGQQPSYTQIKAQYVSAKDDFAPSVLEINDRARRERLGKVSPKELDLTAVDNYNQARRLSLLEFAKYIDHHWFNSLGSSGVALLLEENDVISSSDDSGGIVNELTQIEEFSVSLESPFAVQVTRARRYRTAMFRDLVPKTAPVLPSVLEWATVLPTVFKAVDAPAIFPEHFGEPGVYLVVGRPAALRGDWRGAHLWADFGAGYRQLTTEPADVAASLGTESGTPPTTPADFSAVDTTSVLTAAFDDDGALGATATTAELAADPLKNLIAYEHAGGWEYIQYATRTLINAATRTYQLTNLLRGRFGTEGYAAHAAGQRVVTMAGAVFVPLDAEEAGTTFPLKAVTVRQDVASAVASNLTFRGGPGRPLRVRDFVGIRDAGGNWQFAGRGHEYPGEHDFVVRAKTADGLTVKRELKTLPGFYNPALLNVTPGSTPFVVYPEGAKYTPSGYTSNEVVNTSSLLALSPQRGYFTTSVDSDPLLLQATWQLDANIAGDEVNAPVSSFGFTSGGVTYEIRVTPPNLSTPLTVSRLQVAVGSGGGSVIYTDLAGEASRTRYTVEVKMGQVRFYRNYTDEGSVPFYTYQGAPPAMPVAPYAFAGGAQSWRQIGFVTAGLGFWATYTAAEQVADYGAAQSNLRVEAYQRRTFRGVRIDGHKIDLTF